uniref:Serine aminopeptidase S33 domain-containing protein n=1 Tax=Plectus sambesii TaxID=2011161 RepID=A0A914UYV7_9BILA
MLPRRRFMLIKNLTMSFDSEVRYLSRSPRLPPLPYIKVYGDQTKATVIFVHGFCSDKDVDKAIRLQTLVTEKGYSFIRFDLTDHGEAVFPCKPGKDPHARKLLDFKVWKEDLRLVIEKLTPTENIILIGDSMGVWLSILNIIDLPDDKIKGLVGISSAVDFFERFNSSFFGADEEKRIAQGEIVWVRGPYGDYVGAKQLTDTAKDFQIFGKGKIPVRCPCRFVHRLGDVLALPETAMLLTKKLESKDVEIRFKKGGDHRMANDDDFELMADAVQQILQLAEKD